MQRCRLQKCSDWQEWNSCSSSSAGLFHHNMWKLDVRFGNCSKNLGTTVKCTGAPSGLTTRQKWVNFVPWPRRELLAPLVPGQSVWVASREVEQMGKFLLWRSSAWDLSWDLFLKGGWRQQIVLCWAGKPSEGNLWENMQGKLAWKSRSFCSQILYCLHAHDTRWRVVCLLGTVRRRAEGRPDPDLHQLIFSGTLTVY